MAAVSLLVASCGGKETKPNGSNFGREQVTTGETDVVTQRQVTRTIQSQTSVPTVRETSIKADINRMEEKHFVALGFPRELAKSIVEHRDDKGPYKSVDGLREVKGMDEGFLLRMKDRLGASRRD